MIIATREHGYLLLEFNNTTNSFVAELLDELLMWLEQAARDKNIHAIIITSKTKMFSVGGDISQMQDGVSEGKPASYVELIVPKINLIIESIVNHPLPIITALNGTAAGGGVSLFLAGDIRLTSTLGKLVSAFANLALTPDSGATILLPHLLPKSVAFRFLSTNFTLTADKLHNYQVVSEILEPEDILKHAKGLAIEYARLDRWTVEHTKKLANKVLSDRLKMSLTTELLSIIDACNRTAFSEKLVKVMQDLQMKKKN